MPMTAVALTFVSKHNLDVHAHVISINSPFHPAKKNLIEGQIFLIPTCELTL